jgi:hypothetical protein
LNKTFTLSEAQTLLPVLESLLRKAQVAAARAGELDHEIGVQVKDLEQGLLDFPSVMDGQTVLLCWKLGEKEIGFWHTPEDGFAGRKPLAGRLGKAEKERLN